MKVINLALPDDDFADAEERVRNSGVPASALTAGGTDHRLADPEPPAAILRGVKRRTPDSGRTDVARQHLTEGHDEYGTT
jgi:hypothetical protein